MLQCLVVRHSLASTLDQQQLASSACLERSFVGRSSQRHPGQRQSLAPLHSLVVVVHMDGKMTMKNVHGFRYFRPEDSGNHQTGYAWTPPDVCVRASMAATCSPMNWNATASIFDSRTCTLHVSRWVWWKCTLRDTNVDSTGIVAADSTVSTSLRLRFSDSILHSDSPFAEPSLLLLSYAGAMIAPSSTSDPLPEFRRSEGSICRPPIWICHVCKCCVSSCSLSSSN